MTTDILFVVLGSLATILSVFFCALVFGACRRQTRLLWEREQRLPEATKYEFLQQRIAELQQEYDQLRDAIFEAQQLLDERDRAQQRLDEIQAELAKHEMEFADLQKLRHEFESLQADFADLNQRKIDLDQSTRTTQEQHDELNRKLQELNDRVKAEEEKLSEQNKAIEQQSDRLRELQHDVDSLEHKKGELTREMESLDVKAKRRLDDYNAELRGLRNKRDHLDDELTLESDRLADMKKERERTEERLAGMRAEREELNQRLPLLRDDWQQMLTRVGHAADEEKTRELWQPVFLQANYQLQESATEEEALRSLSQYLNELGLRFPPRVLFGFHTALKINDISPLVVLAGISGTGKSELPRRYCEAMGLHFLNIAVQPRWDSPQDMFGFYNYLEGRYRATELGRALVQMDRFHDEDGRGWNPPEDWAANSLSNQVLLVLLDEMNLARIEYYFSEFLSRLEMRRGVDLSSATDRRKAEIPLEVGRATESGAIMHVFVGHNVLFVGTMNEDETTQSLSDKVVDRANVLRFGSPRNLSTSAATSRQGNGRHQTSSRLAYDDWRSWFRSSDALDDHIRDTLHGWMAKLNQALDKIGRPFAYRVSRAIEAYVANFPRVEEAIDEQVRLRWAMADQIEQKIMPKFRGIDPSENEMRAALGLLESVVRELEDEPLLEAIAKSKKEHQFLWQGVQRASLEEV